MQDNNLFQELVALMKKLRGQEGCPWDKEQTHESLKPYLIEEAYEVIDAIDSGDPSKLKEELGDLFFQIIFHSQIAQEERAFGIVEVLKGCLEKMTSRHPHVFGHEQVETAEEVIRLWRKIKKEESVGREKSALGSLPRHLPALEKAHKVQKRAARVGFDWRRVEDVVAKVEEEVAEVKEALKKFEGLKVQGFKGSKVEKSKVEEELGDLLFAVANLCRFLKMSPEDTLNKTVKKFVERFKKVESGLAAQGKDIEHCTLEEMDRIWEEIKRERDQEQTNQLNTGQKKTGTEV
jgi:tetrapyrrole methylase family protein/MazG family protein